VSTLSTAVVKIHWVGAIQVGIVGNVDGLAIQEDTLVFVRVKAERVAVLSEPIDIGIVGKLGSEAHILFLKDEGNGVCIKENLAAVPALDCERKLVLFDIKLEGCVGRLLMLWAGEDLFLNLENLKVGIVDLDMKTLI
jgi:hypothetical protein